VATSATVEWMGAGACRYEGGGGRAHCHRMGLLLFWMPFGFLKRRRERARRVRTSMSSPPIYHRDRGAVPGDWRQPEAPGARGPGHLVPPAAAVTHLRLALLPAPRAGGCLHACRRPSSLCRLSATPPPSLPLQQKHRPSSLRPASSPRPPPGAGRTDVAAALQTTAWRTAGQGVMGDAQRPPRGGRRERRRRGDRLARATSDAYKWPGQLGRALS